MGLMAYDHHLRNTAMWAIENSAGLLRKTVALLNDDNYNSLEAETQLQF